MPRPSGLVSPRLRDAGSCRRSRVRARGGSAPTAAALALAIAAAGLALLTACGLGGPRTASRDSAPRATLAASANRPSQVESPPGGGGLSVPGGMVENVLLVGWDGVERGRLLGLLRAGRLPHLAALRAAGSLRTLAVDGHASDTKAGFAQLLTGYDPEVTGVYSNTRYGSIPPGLSVFERAKDGVGASRLFAAMVTGKGENLGSVERGRLVRLVPPRRERSGQPYAHVRAALDLWDGDTRRAGDRVVRAAERALGQAGARRFLVFVHFGDPDLAGHSAGEASAAYADAIVACDRWLGRLLDWLHGNGVYQHSRVYVATDHGFDLGERSHGSAPRSWLVTNDRSVIASGHLRDVAPTILARMRVPIAPLLPPYPGRLLARR
jgi:hypothetical protein